MQDVSIPLSYQFRLNKANYHPSALLSKNIDGKNGEPYIFRSYDNLDKTGFHPKSPGPANDCEIWQAGRASSAAPPYFKPIDINGDKFVDGGLGYNDPTFVLFSDICIHEGIPFEHINQMVSSILTLGTGLKPTVTAKASGAIVRKVMAEKHIKRGLRFATLLIGTVTSSNHSETSMEESQRIHGFLYRKWDGGKFVGTLPLDKCDDTGFKFMRDWVDKYMAGSTIQAELKEMAMKLVTERRQRYQKTRDRWERFTFSTSIACPFSACPSQVFRTRQEMKGHVMESHGSDTNTDNRDFLSQLIERQPLIFPWMRGPW